MIWKINRDKKGKAKELSLQVLGGCLIVELDAIPTGLSVSEYLDFLIKEKVIVRERQRVYFKKKRFRKKYNK